MGDEAKMANAELANAIEDLSILIVAHVGRSEYDKHVEPVFAEAARRLRALSPRPGHVLVPVEPTEYMIAQGSCWEDPSDLYVDRVNAELLDEGDIARDVWRAMIEAALEAPSDEQERDGG